MLDILTIKTQIAEIYVVFCSNKTPLLPLSSQLLSQLGTLLFIA